MTTLAKAVKTIVENAIDVEYMVRDDVTLNLRQVYEQEYGFVGGCNPVMCKAYLQGLPSVCTIPFYNGEILELLEKAGITRKTEDGQDRLIEAYWNEAGYQFYKLISKL